jgi:hypothetical protein
MADLERELEGTAARRAGLAVKVRKRARKRRRFIKVTMSCLDAFPAELI